MRWVAAKCWPAASPRRSEEHTSELQSPCNLVCRLLLEKKKKSNVHQVNVRWKCTLPPLSTGTSDCRHLTDSHLPHQHLPTYFDTSDALDAKFTFIMECAVLQTFSASHRRNSMIPAAIGSCTVE